MTGPGRILARARRVRARGADGGSLAIAMLVAVIGTGIGALLLPLVLVQIHTSTFDNSRARELSAAEAGTSVALGLVRSATDDTGAGVVRDLPCTTDGPVAGTVAGGAGGLTYRATIGYFVGGENPRGHSGDWLAPYTSTNGGHGMICSPGAGTYYPPTDEDVPTYVLITATGSDARGSRTLRSTYYVQTTNANVAGGTIYVFPESDADEHYCMDAGSARPVAGVQVKLQPCPDGEVVQRQAWAYRDDLSIQLVSSVTSTYSNGLCLSAEDRDGEGQSAGDPITLQPCAQVGAAPWSQQWSVDDYAHLQGSKTDESDLDGLCIAAGSQGAGVGLTLQRPCSGDVKDPQQTWVPSPDVGAGMAGAANDQVVNFQQFGRCIDVTGQDVHRDFLIAYTCKQNPDPDKVAWNQKFRRDGDRWITTPDDGTPYCLHSPLRPYGGRSDGPWVTVVPCPGRHADPDEVAAVSWTRFGATDDHDDPLPARQKYTIEDSAGYCLSLTDDTAAAFDGQYSKVIVAACDGSPLQKWNAAPDLRVPQLKDIHELSGPTG